jgi:hypothetical protein
MESKPNPSLLDFALDEERRLATALEANSQQLIQVRRVIAVYRDIEEKQGDAALRGQTGAPDAGEPVVRDDPQDIIAALDPPVDRSARRRRGRWTWKRSATTEIRRRAEAYLRQKGQRANGPEIARALISQGLRIDGKKPGAVVCARLTSSRLFDHTEAGYGLADWPSDKQADPRCGDGPGDCSRVAGDIDSAPAISPGLAASGLNSHSNPVADSAPSMAVSRAGSLTHSDALRWRDPPRRGLGNGASESARIRNGAAEFLRETQQRASGGEIYAALWEKGIAVNGSDPVTTVCRRLGRSDLFDHTDDGYGLVEWSNTGVPLVRDQK